MMPLGSKTSRFAPWVFFALVGITAVVSSRNDVGGWNDASRLATVESLVDSHTLSIDSSIFAPMTLDKIRVDGRFFSDKPPVPAFWQALLYAALQSCFGITAQHQTGLFCYAMTLGSSGLAYVLAVVAVYRIGQRLDLPTAPRLLLAASFAFATLALVYARQVNGHILILAVTCWLVLGLIPAPNSTPRTPISCRHALSLGMLAALSYAIETGTGPILILGTFCYLAWQGNSWKALAVFTLSTLPLLALHHGACYSIGHVWRPLGTVPEYFQWDGSPFSDGALTGTWMHKHLGIGIRYGIALLIAEHGFITYQPVLWLAGAAFVVLLCRRVPETPELYLAGFWCLGTWSLYTAASNNYAGLCCSIRWFLPLLAPAYYVLAVALRHYPRFAFDLAVVSVWGMMLAIAAWCNGPWAMVSPWLLAGIQTGALSSWIALRVWLKPKGEPGEPLGYVRKKNFQLPLTPSEARL
jgi:hypothetical protein